MDVSFARGFEKTAFLGAALKGVAGFGSRILKRQGTNLVSKAKNVGQSIKANPTRTLTNIGGKTLGAGLAASEVVGIKDNVSQRLNKPTSMTSSSFFSKSR